MPGTPQDRESPWGVLSQVQYNRGILPDRNGGKVKLVRQWTPATVSRPITTFV